MKRTRFFAVCCAAALLLGASAVPAQDTVPTKAGRIDLTETLPQAAASIDLSIPQTFNITRPDEKLTTSYATYYITGTSDPGQPVYYGNTEIQRLGTKGTFGVLVSLNMGNNTFTFRQGDITHTVSITRTGPTATTISNIPQSSMYPVHTGGATAGGTLLVECQAPSGGSVSATFDGRTVNLSQVNSTTAGLPATFRGSIALGNDYPVGETTNQGKITYTLTYGGSSRSYQSTGDVFVAGDGARLAVRVDTYLGALYNDTSNLSIYRERLKEGAVDYVVSQSSGYYQLASGGYLPNDAGAIVEGAARIGNQLNSVSTQNQTKAELYTFQGTETPVFLTRAGESSFSITLYNTSGTPGIDVSGSRLFSSVSVTDNGGSVTYTFQQKAAGNLWGYNVSYDGNNTVLRVAYKPTLSGGAQPLTGITICLDPGHGGKDPGAFGMAGQTGPDESVVNLAHALVVKEMLEAEGARVVMTRDTLDGFLELNERLEFFENSGADMYISLHHNAALESSNGNNLAGLEVYYHTPNSANLASNMMSALASGTGRTNRKVQKDYYRVTVLPYAPSILCELGFMINPVEYEKATTQSQIDITAQSIVNGIKRSLG